jgi:predicted HicB family RNase H-like nuclease
MPTKKKAAIIEAPTNTDHAKTNSLTVKRNKNKLVVLKLPSTLKKAARMLARAQDMKLRDWIIEIIEQRVAQ